MGTFTRLVLIVILLLVWTGIRSLGIRGAIPGVLFGLTGYAILAGPINAAFERCRPRKSDE